MSCSLLKFFQRFCHDDVFFQHLLFSDDTCREFLVSHAQHVGQHLQQAFDDSKEPLPKRECHQVSPLLFEQFAHRLVVVEALVEGQGDICHVAECAVSNLTVEVPSLIAAEPKILLALFCQHLYAPTYLVGLEASASPNQADANQKFYQWQQVKTLRNCGNVTNQHPSKAQKILKKAAYKLIFSRFFHIFAVETQNDCI